jgi:hypothetical protein
MKIPNLIRYLRKSYCALCIAFVGCGASNLNSDSPISAYLEEKVFTSRYDEKYKKTIYTLYTNDEFTDNFAEFKSSLDKKWNVEDYSYPEEGVFKGTSTFSTEGSKVVIDFSQLSSSEKNMDYKYILTIIVGDRLE